LLEARGEQGQSAKLRPKWNPEKARDWLERGRAIVEKAASEAEVNVFVLGPAVGNREAPAAAALRRALIERCQAEVGFSAYAEHEEIIQTFGGQISPGADLCTIELLYAKNVNMLVFIPASHGSAAEIGYFAAVFDPPSKLARRCVILLDQQFATLPGFVSGGPVRVLRAQGARVEPIDYEDIEAAWEVVKAEADDERLQLMRAKAISESA
jgi:hypothetical protein